MTPVTDTNQTADPGVTGGRTHAQELDRMVAEDIARAAVQPMTVRTTSVRWVVEWYDEEAREWRPARSFTSEDEARSYLSDSRIYPAGQAYRAVLLGTVETRAVQPW